MFLFYSFFAKDKLVQTGGMLPGGRFRNYLVGFIVLGRVIIGKESGWIKDNGIFLEEKEDVCCKNKTVF